MLERKGRLQDPAPREKGTHPEGGGVEPGRPVCFWEISGSLSPWSHYPFLVGACWGHYLLPARMAVRELSDQSAHPRTGCDFRRFSFWYSNPPPPAPAPHRTPKPLPPPPARSQGRPSRRPALLHPDLLRTVSRCSAPLPGLGVGGGKGKVEEASGQRARADREAGRAVPIQWPRLRLPRPDLLSAHNQRVGGRVRFAV